MPGTQPLVQIKNINKFYGENHVVKDLSIDVQEGEFLTILGSSGSGKSTTLRMVAGFEQPTTGEILLAGTNVADKEPFERDVNTVFQSYALFPHMTIFDNVAYGLKMKRVSKDEIRERVMEMLDLVQLGGFEGRKPDQLSGGQKQRVAIARALVNRPKILLLDEPLGALDLKLRKEMQGELMRIQKSLKITFIYVTHDQEEALTMSDRVVVMKDGEIQQIGTPQDIYNEPKNAFVADFIGESNIIDGVMYEDFEVEFAGQAFKCVDKGFAENERVDVVIRPEDIIVGDYETSPISGEVESVIFKGVHYEITVDAHGYKWLIHSTQSQPVGAHIGMNVRPEDIHIMKKMEAKAR